MVIFESVIDKITIDLFIDPKLVLVVTDHTYYTRERKYYPNNTNQFIIDYSEFELIDHLYKTDIFEYSFMDPLKVAVFTLNEVGKLKII